MLPGCGIVPPLGGCLVLYSLAKAANTAVFVRDRAHDHGHVRAVAVCVLVRRFFVMFCPGSHSLCSESKPLCLRFETHAHSPPPTTTTAARTAAAADTTEAGAQHQQIRCKNRAYGCRIGATHHTFKRASQPQQIHRQAPAPLARLFSCLFFLFCRTHLSHTPPTTHDATPSHE